MGLGPPRYEEDAQSRHDKDDERKRGSVIEVDTESEPFGVLSIELSVGRGA